MDDYVDKEDNPYNLKSNPQSIANDIIRKLDQVILPVFDALSSRESIIENLKAYPEFNSFRNHLVDGDIALITECLSKKCPFLH